MRKPQDSDIFGTRHMINAPRIQNDQVVDPNAAFKKKMDAQYNKYANKVHSVQRTITVQPNQSTKVNEEVQFDENYHHSRKEADMQSTIFSNPSQKFSESRATQFSKLTQKNIPKHPYQSEKQIDHNFGRKQTLTRQVHNLPENKAEFKGNCSSIFGYDQKDERNDVKNQVQRLIPHQMKWNQHDSIRYQGENPYETEENLAESNYIGEVPKNIIQKVEKIKLDEEKKENDVKEVNVKRKEQAKQKNQKEVEIMILKGWNSNMLEGLSKFCKINSTKIVSVTFDEGGKGTLILTRSKRWENITDWLRKDAKLKIRVK